ncbi:MAG: hypothetical protein PVSMB11_06590 [Desulfuromonadaceae bacterium]
MAGLEFNGISYPSFPTLKYAETFLIEKALELANNNQGAAARSWHFYNFCETVKLDFNAVPVTVISGSPSVKKGKRTC